MASLGLCVLCAQLCPTPAAQRTVAGHSLAPLPTRCSRQKHCGSVSRRTKRGGRGRIMLLVYLWDSAFQDSTVCMMCVQGCSLWWYLSRVKKLETICQKIIYSRTIKKAKCWRIDAVELWCWRDSWESPGLQGDPTSPSWRRSALGVHWKDWCWSWTCNTLVTWFKGLTHLKTPWCWERLRAGGEGDIRGWDGGMASPTQWTWVWVSSRSWWWTGKPGVLRFMGSQRVRHDWATELNWCQKKLERMLKKKKSLGENVISGTIKLEIHLPLSSAKTGPFKIKSSWRSRC